MWEVAQRGWNDPTGRPVPFLTASFEVTFHRPAPLGPSVQLNALPESIDPSHIIVKSEMSIDDKVRATMTASWAPIRSR
jgi:acyl-CoA thioesterase FadM